MMRHDYVTLKLVNGDNLISVLVNEDDSKYVLMYPIQMKTVNYNLDGKHLTIHQFHHHNFQRV